MSTYITIQTKKLWLVLHFNNDTLNVNINLTTQQSNILIIFNFFF